MRPDIDAIRARNMVDWIGKKELAADVAALLAYIDDLERDLLNERATFESCNRARMHCEYECATLKARTTYTVGETEWAHRIATLEHMLSEERENVDTLRREIDKAQAAFDYGCGQDGPNGWRPGETALDALVRAKHERDELLRVNKGAAQYGIITECVRELIELLGIQLQNPTANETVDAAANEIKTLRTTVEELKARITTLEAMR